MDKQFKTKAKYENGYLKPEDHLELTSGEEVDLIIIKHEIIKEDFTDEGIIELAANNPSFDFLNSEEENIYSTSDLKKWYKK